MGGGQALQEAFAPRGELHQRLATVGHIAHAANESARLHAIDELDRAVVPELEALGQRAHVRAHPFRHALHGEQQLMLLRLEPRLTTGALAEAEEAPQLIAELGQRLVVGARELGGHSSLIYRPTI